MNVVDFQDLQGFDPDSFQSLRGGPRPDTQLQFLGLVPGSNQSFNYSGINLSHQGPGLHGIHQQQQHHGNSQGLQHMHQLIQREHMHSSMPGGAPSSSQLRRQGSLPQGQHFGSSVRGLSGRGVSDIDSESDEGEEEEEPKSRKRGAASQGMEEAERKQALQEKNRRAQRRFRERQKVGRQNLH
jgi:hypothetical protein